LCQAIFEHRDLLGDLISDGFDLHPPQSVAAIDWPEWRKSLGPGVLLTKSGVLLPDQSLKPSCITTSGSSGWSKRMPAQDPRCHTLVPSTSVRSGIDNLMCSPSLSGR
jgi:hypothetical protein